jgi:uncharacterized membrane protein
LCLGGHGGGIGGIFRLIVIQVEFLDLVFSPLASPGIVKAGAETHVLLGDQGQEHSCSSSLVKLFFAINVM